MLESRLFIAPRASGLEARKARHAADGNEFSYELDMAATWTRTAEALSMQEQVHLYSEQYTAEDI